MISRRDVIISLGPRGRGLPRIRRQLQRGLENAFREFPRDATTQIRTRLRELVRRGDVATRTTRGVKTFRLTEGGQRMRELHLMPIE